MYSRLCKCEMPTSNMIHLNSPLPSLKNVFPFVILFRLQLSMRKTARTVHCDLHLSREVRCFFLSNAMFHRCHGMLNWGLKRHLVLSRRPSWSSEWGCFVCSHRWTHAARLKQGQMHLMMLRERKKKRSKCLRIKDRLTKYRYSHCMFLQCPCENCNT